jgi:hypothetical protein
MKIVIEDVGLRLEVTEITTLSGMFLKMFMTSQGLTQLIEVTKQKQPVDPPGLISFPLKPVKLKRAYVRHKTLNFTKERDKIIRDNFDVLGHSGIYDKSLLPGFSLAEIRQRCIKLGLLDKFGVRPDHRGKHGAETA